MIHPYRVLTCLLSLWLMVGSYALSAQVDFNTTIRGLVRDAVTGRPLEGASVNLGSTDQGASTDSLGRFRLTGMPPGRYYLRITYVGYETLEVPEVLVTTGKETVLDLALREGQTTLAVATVRAPRIDTRPSSPTVRTLTLEETLRFAATFYDPARLALALPGVVQADDQGNGMSVRGHSPNGLSWRLEGLEIVNPNHTSNAGTFSDLPTLNGGGVNALSAQLLDNSLFFSGAFPAPYGNALSAILDMRLRPGNNERREYTIQAGLIGIDLSAEGPFSRRGTASYLLNYRYSFTGLLSDLDVKLGDEDIRFQDLSVNLVFPNRQGGRWTVFGLWGKSSNEFTGPADSLRETAKDLYNRIDFDSDLAIGGLTWTRPVGRNGQWRMAAAYSRADAWRLAEYQDTVFLQQDRYNLYQAKLTTQAAYQLKIGSLHSLEVGTETTWQEATALQWLPGQSTQSAGYGDWLIQPYASWQQRWPAWTLNAGLHLSMYRGNLGQVIYPEPRASLEWKSGPSVNWSLSYGLHSQISAPNLYVSNDLLPQRAHHTVLAWRQQLGTRTEAGVQAYYQSLFNLAVAAEVANAFSAVNQLETFSDFMLANEGRGRNQGVELYLQRFVGEGWSFLLSGSLYDARYRGSDGVWRDSRYNGRYATTLTLGREWVGQEQGERPRRFGFNAILRLAGGQRAPVIDQAASAAAVTTIFDYTQGFPEQLPTYYRADLRIYYQRNRPRWSSTLALDIQNVTDRANVAYYYYDRFQDKVVTRYQLGVIPVLSYRLNFAGK